MIAPNVTLLIVPGSGLLVLSSTTTPLGAGSPSLPRTSPAQSKRHGPGRGTRR